MAKKNPHPLDGSRNAAMETIGKIADRAVLLYATYEVRANRMDVLMDLMAVHFDVQKLRLDELLAADDFNFMHDIGGINRHLNRETIDLNGNPRKYELLDGFRPRFSVPNATAAAA